MACVVDSGTLCGVDGVSVSVEVDLLRRLPCVVIVGLASGAVRESADRVRSAIQATGMSFPRKRVVVNLAPASLKKSGAGFDLPISIGILAASEQVPLDRVNGTVFIGELSLEGRLRPVRGALSIALMAAKAGAQRVVVPAASAAEAAAAPGIEVLSATSLTAVVHWLAGKGSLPVAQVAARPARASVLDLSEVRGQARARRALEIAAAGGHNLLMVGPPGCGKTMLAARLPTILPVPSFSESIDITRVHSAAGLAAGQGLLLERPFRAPHHTISAAGMVGGASLRPGELSLAHNGVLFLDELPEFSRSVLELLRSPLEERRVRLCRAAGTINLPASVSLVAAANPCPCGFRGHPTQPCGCSRGVIDRYWGRLSGPLLDRIDLQIWLQPVDPSVLGAAPSGEASEPVRQRVEAARARQQTRYRDSPLQTNAELQGDGIRTASDATPEALRLLEQVTEQHGLSARTWSRILKVSRTIADLDGADCVDQPHILEASAYRVAVGSAA